MNNEFLTSLKTKLSAKERQAVLSGLVELSYLDAVSENIEPTGSNNANESFLSDLQATAISAIERAQNRQRQAASCKNVDWDAINKLPHNMEADNVLY